MSNCRTVAAAFHAGILGVSVATVATLPLGVDAAHSEPERSPIYGVRIPDDYRQWELVSVSHETEPLNELRAIVGNEPVLKAFRAGDLPFPDGAILVKLAWKRVQSSEFAPAFVPGATTTVQVMVKDSARYAATGGWGWGRFVDGKPADEAQHQTCLGCHTGNVRQHDLVFTRLTP